MAEAHVEYEPGMVRVSFPYDADVLYELKRMIPARERHWNSKLKSWDFTPAGWERARPILEDGGFDILD